MSKQSIDQSVANLPDAHFRDDEINLFDLLADLNVQKRWVAMPLIACVMLALIYVSIAKPVYQVKSVVKPAAVKELVELNPPQLGGGGPMFFLWVLGRLMNTVSRLYCLESFVRPSTIKIFN